MTTLQEFVGRNRKAAIWIGGAALILLLVVLYARPDAFSPFFGGRSSSTAEIAEGDDGLAAQGAAGRFFGILRDIAGRSPGVRVGGIALKGKARLASASLKSIARPGAATGKGPRPANPATTAPVVPPIFAGPAATPGIVLPEFPDIAQAPSGPTVPGGTGFPGGGGFIPPIGGGGIVIGGPGGGGGGGGGGVINPPLPPVPPPTGGIPEPSVWLVLTMGFGLIGGAMRRKRSAIFV